MSDIREITFPVFYAWVDDVSLKEQAIKIIEEAAEVLGAVQNEPEYNVVREIIDVIQACCNMLNLMDIPASEIRLACSDELDSQIERGRLPRILTFKGGE